MSTRSHALGMGAWVATVVSTITIWRPSAAWLAFMFISSNAFTYALARCRARAIERHARGRGHHHPDPLPWLDDQAGPPRMISKHDHDGDVITEPLEMITPTQALIF